jgi:hypothetical protein
MKLRVEFTNCVDSFPSFSYKSDIIPQVGEYLLIPMYPRSDFIITKVVHEITIASYHKQTIIYAKMI